MALTASQRKQLRRALEALLTSVTARAPARIEPNRTDEAEVGGDEDEQPLNEMLQAIASNRNRSSDRVLERTRRALERLKSAPEDAGLLPRMRRRHPLGAAPGHALRRAVRRLPGEARRADPRSHPARDHRLPLAAMDRSALIEQVAGLARGGPRPRDARRGGPAPRRGEARRAGGPLPRRAGVRHRRPAGAGGRGSESDEPRRGSPGHRRPRGLPPRHRPRGDPTWGGGGPRRPADERGVRRAMRQRCSVRWASPPWCGPASPPRRWRPSWWHGSGPRRG